MIRTFRREDLDASHAAWDAGDFSDEWKPFRHQAAMLGMIYPPEGTKWDNWEDDQPSQRAMLIRAIRETPTLLSKCIVRSRSWGQVIAELVKERDDLREHIQAEARWSTRHNDEPTPRQALMSFAEIVARVRDSLP